MKKIEKLVKKNNYKHYIEELKTEHGDSVNVNKKKRKLKYKFPAKIEVYYELELTIDEKRKLLNKLKRMKKEKTNEEQYNESMGMQKQNKIEDENIQEPVVYNNTEQSIKNYLIEQGVTKKIAEEILLKHKYNVREKDVTEKDSIERVMSEVVTENGMSFSEQGTIVLLGPTGVGKTTTSVKLVNKNKEKTVLVTNDDVRLGAKEETKLYGKKYGFVTKESDVDQYDLIDNLRKKYDRVVVDMPGINPKNKTRTNEIKQYLKRINAENSYLVISSTQKIKDIENMIELYSDVGLSGVIFTKMDETSEVGFLINLCYNKLKLPVVYITNGQNPKGFIQGFSKKSYFDFLWKDLKMSGK